MLSAYIRWDFIALLVALVIVLTLELMGVFGARFVTITALVRAWIPIPARAAILLWLAYHFLIAGANYPLSRGLK